MTQRDQPARTGSGRFYLPFRRNSPLRLLLRALAVKILEACRDLLPICLVIAVFQGLVLRQPLPDLSGVLAGLVLVILGLALLVLGLEQGLFPLGEALALALARKGSFLWLSLFAFGLGLAATIAEPALMAVASEGAKAAVEAGHLEASRQASYAMQIRLVIGFSVGLAIVLGVIRLLKGWPLPYFILGGYALVMVLSLFAPPAITGIAFDSGGVTTSTVTVPLVTALGVGLASSIRGRNPLVDGFGMIALAMLFPVILLLAFGALTL